MVGRGSIYMGNASEAGRLDIGSARSWQRKRVLRGLVAVRRCAREADQRWFSEFGSGRCRPARRAEQWQAWRRGVSERDAVREGSGACRGERKSRGYPEAGEGIRVANTCARLTRVRDGRIVR